MTREFLKNLGLEDSAIDKILDENMRDIGKEKANTTTAQTELSTVKETLKTAQGELDTLKKSNGDITAVQKQLSDLQAKYDTDIADRDAKLADRDYSDAITRAITGKALKFSSKSAEWAFIAAIKEKKLELKDGELVGLDDFIKAQKEADPDAFAPDKPAPRFLTGGSGSGYGELPKPISRAAQLAAEHHNSLYGEAKKE